MGIFSGPCLKSGNNPNLGSSQSNNIMNKCKDCVKKAKSLIFHHNHPYLYPHLQLSPLYLHLYLYMVQYFTQSQPNINIFPTLIQSFNFFSPFLVRFTLDKANFTFWPIFDS